MSELPDSWLTCKLGDVINYGTTQKVEPTEIPDDAWVLELEDIEKDTSKILQRLTFKQRQSKSTKSRFASGDILYGKLRPYLNKVVRADQDGYCTTEIIPIKFTEIVDGAYLFRWLKTPAFIDYATSVSHGLNMPRLGTEAGKQAPFVLAPLPEQKRIADKLDEVLVRVDACRDRLDRIPAILKRFRQSVLAAATSGRLTEDWRAENRLPEPEPATLGEILKVSSGNFLPAKDMTIGGIVPVYGGNGVNGYHDKGNVNSEALVIGRVGFYCGSVHLTPPHAWVTDNALIVRHDEAQTLKRFLFYALQATDLRANDSSSAQPVISGAKIYPTPILVPHLLEQTEIVRRVEALFAMVDRLEARHKAARAQVEKLTPATLAKAFRGELVPQDPSDEPASKLLERIRAISTPESSKPRGRKLKAKELVS